MGEFVSEWCLLCAPRAHTRASRPAVAVLDRFKRRTLLGWSAFLQTVVQASGVEVCRGGGRGGGGGR